MTYSVEVSDLKKSLGHVSSVVERSTASIMEAVEIVAQDNALTLRGTNHRIEAQARCPAAVTGASKMCVSAVDLKAVIGRLPGVVEVEWADDLNVKGEMIIRNPKLTMKIPVTHGDLPRRARPQNEEEVEGGVAAFLAAVPFASKDETKWTQGGVFFDGKFAVATNSKSLIATPVYGGKGQCVPFSAQRIMQKIGGRLFLGDDSWRVEADGFHACGATVDTQMIDWHRIDFDSAPFMTIDREEAITAVESVTVGRSRMVHFGASGGGYVLSGEDFGDKRPLLGEYILGGDGSPLSFSASTAETIQCLRALDSETVALSTNGRAVKITGKDTYILMQPFADRRSQLEAA